jgi:uncharacterized protein YkwD
MRRRMVFRVGLYAAAVSAAVLLGAPSMAAPGNGAPVPAGGLYDSGVPAVAGAPTPATTPPPAPHPVPTPSATPTPAPAPPTSPPPSPAPSPTPTAGPVVPPQSQVSRNITNLLALTNQDRLNNGCQALALNTPLMRAAYGHARDMSERDYFSHTSLDGRTYDQRIRAAGFTGDDIGENIASGFGDAPEVQDAWMDHAGHRRNILDCSFKWIGISYFPQGEYWVVDFGG